MIKLIITAVSFVLFKYNYKPFKSFIHIEADNFQGNA